MASEGEAGSAAATEADPGEGYIDLVAPKIFLNSLIWEYIQYVFEENSAVRNVMSELAC